MADMFVPAPLTRSHAVDATHDGAGFTLRSEADLGIAKVQVFGRGADARFAQVTGLQAPAPRTQHECGALTVSWLAPGEWMILGTQAEIEALTAVVQARDDEDVLAIDVSHGRASLLLGGLEARAALAAHCPLDTHPDAFAVNAVGRSILGESGLFVSRLADVSGEPLFRLIVDQTMAAYAVRLLSSAPRQGAFA